jgi:hypothetical protein
VVLIFLVWLNRQISLVQGIARDLAEAFPISLFGFPIAAGIIVALLAFAIHRRESGRKVAAIATVVVGECILLAPLALWVLSLK